ncbi:MAG TPA: alanine:cation symporter family protein, partial [Desulfosporosinus sp.]|nr:alanine:cation symporter family protein [Desulfosporosinus sp.]
MALPVVWDMADAMNALMAIPNLICLLLLSGVVVSETKKYLWDDNLDGISTDPIRVLEK